MYEPYPTCTITCCVTGNDGVFQIGGSFSASQCTYVTYNTEEKTCKNIDEAVHKRRWQRWRSATASGAIAKRKEMQKKQK